MIEKTKKTYILTDTHEESKLVQKYLFSQGYRWAGEGTKKDQIVKHYHQPALVIKEDQKHMWYVTNLQRIAYKCQVMPEHYTCIQGKKFASPLYRVLNGG